MVLQSLKQYYKTHLEDIPQIENKLESSVGNEDFHNPFNDIDTAKIVRLTDYLRIVDPAVGSGAFPMGILNKLVFILSKLNFTNNKLWKETQIQAVEGVPRPCFFKQCRFSRQMTTFCKNSHSK